MNMSSHVRYTNAAQALGPCHEQIAVAFIRSSMEREMSCLVSKWVGAKIGCFVISAFDPPRSVVSALDNSMHVA